MFSHLSMAVRMPDRGLVFERVTFFYCSKSHLCCRLCQMFVNSHNKNRMTRPLHVAKNCTTHPLPRVQKLMTHPLSAPAHPPPPPPILFDQSLNVSKKDLMVQKNASDLLVEFESSFSFVDQRLNFIVINTHGQMAN